MFASPIIDYMDYAISLGELALGYTSPNPAVGAVIVKDGVVIGLGHTQPPGSAHAEVMALRQAGNLAKGAAMFVSLEPCCHEGRTPPCTDAIIKAGISKVHVAMIDPNPLVNGKGIQQLREAGIEVIVGDHEAKARAVNEGYVKHITTGFPFVIAKFAMSMDGKIATRSGDSKWISSEETREYVHRIRRAIDAIMVGANTIITDNPKLTARGTDKGGRTKSQPLRVIIDGKGRTPANAQIFKEPGKTLITVAKPLDAKKLADYEKAGAEVLQFHSKDQVIDLVQVMETLGKRNITGIMVEGGSTLFGSLFDQGMIDKVLVCISPIIIGGDEAKTAVGGKGVNLISEALRLQNVRIDSIGEDILLHGYVDRS